MIFGLLARKKASEVEAGSGEGLITEIFIVKVRFILQTVAFDVLAFAAGRAKLVVIGLSESAAAVIAFAD